MKDADTTKTMLDRSKELIDWTRFDAMTDAARHLAARVISTRSRSAMRIWRGCDRYHG